MENRKPGDPFDPPDPFDPFARVDPDEPIDPDDPKFSQKPTKGTKKMARGLRELTGMAVDVARTDTDEHGRIKGTKRTKWTKRLRRAAHREALHLGRET